MYDAILGQDFLVQYQAWIDLQTNVLDLEIQPLSFSETSKDNETPIVCFITA